MGRLGRIVSFGGTRASHGRHAVGEKLALVLTLLIALLSLPGVAMPRTLASTQTSETSTSPTTEQTVDTLPTQTLVIDGLKPGDQVTLMSIAKASIDADGTLSETWDDTLSSIGSWSPDTLPAWADYNAEVESGTAGGYETAVAEIMANQSYYYTVGTNEYTQTAGADETRVTFSDLPAGDYLVRIQNSSTLDCEAGGETYPFAPQDARMFNPVIARVLPGTASDGTYTSATTTRTITSADYTTVTATLEVSTDGKTWASNVTGITQGQTLYFRVTTQLPEALSLRQSAVTTGLNTDAATPFNYVVETAAGANISIDQNSYAVTIGGDTVSSDNTYLQDNQEMGVSITSVPYTDATTDLGMNVSEIEATAAGQDLDVSFTATYTGDPNSVNATADAAESAGDFCVATPEFSPEVYGEGGGTVYTMDGGLNVLPVSSQPVATVDVSTGNTNSSAAADATSASTSSSDTADNLKTISASISARTFNSGSASASDQSSANDASSQSSTSGSSDTATGTLPSTGGAGAGALAPAALCLMASAAVALAGIRRRARRP